MARPRKDPKDYLPDGRPPKYNNVTTIQKTREYINQCEDEWNEFHKTRGEKSDSYERYVNVKLPTVAGLAVHLGVSRETVHTWAKEHSKFSDIYNELLSIQEQRLIQGSLSGAYNSSITKLLLTKHGYRDSVENDVTSKGEKIDAIQFIFPQSGDNSVDTE